MADRKPQRQMRHGGPHGGMGHIEKPKDFKGTLSKLAIYMKNYLPILIFVVICSAGSTVFSIVGPKQTGKITTIIAEGFFGKMTGGAGINFEKILDIIYLLIIFYVVSAILGIVSGQIISTVSMKVTFKMRKEVSEKINRMPMKFFDGKTHGEVLSIIINDVDTLGNSLNQSIMQLITSLTTIIGILYMMFSINALVTCIALFVLPISGILVGFVVKASQKHFKAQQEYLGHVNGQVEEVFGGQVIVKAFNQQKRVVDVFEKDNDTLYNSAWKSQFLSGLMMPCMIFVGNLAYVAICILGGILVIKGKMKVGDIQSFIGYIRQFTQPISQLAQVSAMIQSAIAASERIFKFLEEEEEENSPKTSPVAEIKGIVEFKDVKFGYDPEKTVINNFSSKFQQGQRIAIVGNTGAGKTTIVKLLMRFYELQGGEILLDGHNINEFSRSQLRGAFGMVLQDTWLFKGSIMENIRYGRLSATDEEVIEAAKAAHAHRFISALPGGYNMELSEDAGNISAGQKQLLTIARSMLANNRIAILDEATSSVDTRTEQRIQRAMEKMMTGRTSFVIAHRLSTIKDADTILVMKNGDIAEQGNHGELLENNGVYASLYRAQFESAS